MFLLAPKNLTKILIGFYVYKVMLTKFFLNIYILLIPCYPFGCFTFDLCLHFQHKWNFSCRPTILLLHIISLILLCRSLHMLYNTDVLSPWKLFFIMLLSNVGGRSMQKRCFHLRKQYIPICIIRIVWKYATPTNIVPLICQCWNNSSNY